MTPKIALHTLTKEETFAFVFQILDLKGQKTTRDAKSHTGNRMEHEISKPNENLAEKIPSAISKDYAQIIATLEQEKINLERLLVEKAQNYETLQIQFKELTEERNRLLEVENEKYGANQRISELETAISNMKIKMYDYLEQKKKADADRSTALEENEIIKGKFSSLDQQIQTLLQENTQLKNEKQDQQTKFDEQLEGLNKILRDLEGKYAQLQTDHKENQEKSIELAKLLNTYKTQSEELQTTVQNQQIIQENMLEQLQSIANELKSPMMKIDKLIETRVKTSKH